MRALGLLITGLLAIALAVALNPRLRRMFTPEPPEAPNDTRGDLKVWVNKRSGFYYCPSSQAYGSLEPGEFMTQDRALQTGFRLAPHVPCADATMKTASRSNRNQLKAHDARSTRASVVAAARRSKSSKSPASDAISAKPAKSNTSDATTRHVYVAHAIQSGSPQAPLAADTAPDGHLTIPHSPGSF